MKDSVFEGLGLMDEYISQALIRPHRLVRDYHLLLPKDPGSLTFPLEPRLKRIGEPIEVKLRDRNKQKSKV